LSGADKGGDGFLETRTSKVFVAKASDFSKIIVCPLGQWRGVEAERTRGKEAIFGMFLQTSFMDCP